MADITEDHVSADPGTPHGWLAFTVVAGCLLTFLLGNLAFVERVQALAKQNWWLEHKVSKGFLLDNFEPGELDIVFIGSSRTQTHIDTPTFRRAGLNIFNYGVPGRLITEYPYMVDRALQARPKMVVLSAPYEHLAVRTGIRGNSQITVYDMWFHLQNNSERVGKSAIRRFWDRQLPLTQYFSHYRQRLAMSATVRDDVAMVEEAFGVPIDADEVLYVRRNNRRAVTVFRVGDAIAWSTIKRNLDPATTPTEFDEHTVKYMNALARKIREGGAKAILNVEPGTSQELCCFSKPLLKRVFTDFDDIHLTVARFQGPDHYRPEEWADRSHLNQNGRLRYSDYLVRVMNRHFDRKLAER